MTIGYCRRSEARKPECMRCPWRRVLSRRGTQHNVVFREGRLTEERSHVRTSARRSSTLSPGARQTHVVHLALPEGREGSAPSTVSSIPGNIFIYLASNAAWDMGKPQFKKTERMYKRLVSKPGCLTLASSLKKKKKRAVSTNKPKNPGLSD